ncbi:hypothetical protein GA0111570_10280 [Raineyella antarctica]|uniref:DUF222 domain-containing protein n=1 Tax=Raineyella antarctica TaxID=1577474 RepID=A0A1G6GEA9_9ACTN|nr:HNH endonuclease signature motif containing protein [Raineyella antarctica]SDB80294.1 hypothetical protein GA0111570_10280 [Raineyella antarctica]
MSGTLFDAPEPDPDDPYDDPYLEPYLETGAHLAAGSDTTPRLDAPELDTGPIDEAETTVADVVMPIALDPDRVLPGSVQGALDEMDALRTLRAATEARQFALIGHLASIAPPPAQEHLEGGEQLVDLGGDGCPTVPEFLVLELAALLRTTHQSARGMVADALSASWRHPRLWQAVMAGRVPVWQARKVAQAVRWAGLDRTRALQVDRNVAPALGTVSWPRLEALVEGEIVNADPDRAAEAEQRARTGRFARVARDERGHAGVRTFVARLGTPEALQLDATISRLAHRLGQNGDTDSLDARRARALGILATPERAAALLAGDNASADRLKPPVRLYLHLNAERLGADGVARLEGEGAVPVQALRELLADSNVRVTCVIDHRTSEPVDAYEIPERMREQVTLANPYEVFPWGTRRARHSDLDHTKPYAEGGETRVENLGPLGRSAHRAKTHAGWRCRQVQPGQWLWRSPYGRWYDVDNWGTRTAVASAAPSTIEHEAIKVLNTIPRTSPGDAPAPSASSAALARRKSLGRGRRRPRAAQRAARRRRRH